MALPKRQWQITNDKFLSLEQIERLKLSLLNHRDLAIVRANAYQGMRDFYAVRTVLESGLRVFEFCALINEDFQGLKILVRNGKGHKPRTAPLTRSTAAMLNEWLAIRERLGGHPPERRASPTSSHGSAQYDPKSRKGEPRCVCRL